MFRRTTISLAIASLATVAVASTAPAFAAPATGESITTTDIGGDLIDFTVFIAEVPVESIDPGEVTMDCSVDTDDRWTPCIDLGSILVIPSVEEPEVEESLTPGGVVSDAPIDVVEPESDLLDPELLPDISDIIDFPGVSDTDAPEASESDGVVLDIDRSDLADALRDAGIGTIEDATDAAGISESDDSGTVTESAPTSTEEPTEAAASSGMTSDAATATMAAPEERDTEHDAAEATTTTVPVVDEIEDDPTVLAAIDLPTPANPDQGIGPLLGALFGGLAALALAGSGFAAFKLGRRDA